MTDLRFPIGEYAPPKTIALDLIREWTGTLERAPRQYRQAVTGLSEEQLDTPYRPDGWTVRQVVHHVPDSHFNAYARFKLALTENEPTVKPYDEAAWAELEDGRTGPVGASLDMLEGLHSRWVRMLRAMTPEDFAKRFNHPERGVIRLDWTLGLYAWHCDHHLAHITGLRERNGW